MSYCEKCGSLLKDRELKNEGLIPYCEKCGEYRFKRYNVAVSMIVVNKSDGRILLIKQYGRDRYILVAGYVNRGEKLEEAVVREVMEETGLTVTEMHFNRTSFFEPSDTLMNNFTVYVDPADKLHVNEEVDSYMWFTPQEARANIAAPSLAGDFLNKFLDENGCNT